MYPLTPTLHAPLNSNVMAWDGYPQLPSWGHWPPVTVVEGVWGCGKSSWVYESLNRHTAVSGRIAWVHLTPYHNLPHTFWPAVLNSLQQINPTLATAAQTLLETILLVPHLSFVNLLRQELAQQTEPLVLVLDNYELINYGGLPRALAFLADDLPPNFRLVLITNSTPTLNLEGVEARGELWRISLDHPLLTVATLTERWNQLEPAAQTLLQQTRRWPWLCAELIRTINQNGDLAPLEALARGGFLRPVQVLGKPGYYAYHELVQQEPSFFPAPPAEEQAVISRRAIGWLHQTGAIFEACAVALQAELWLEAVMLLEEPTLFRHLLTRGAYDLAVQWATAVPHAIATQRPLLSIYLAWAYLHQDEYDHANQAIAQTEAALPYATQYGLQNQISTYLATVRACVGYATHQYNATLAYAHLALETLPSTMPGVRAYVSICLADAYRQQENYAASRDAFAQANALFTANTNDYLVTWGALLHGRLWQEWGQLQRAHEIYQETINRLRRGTLLLESPLLGEAYLGLGQILYEQNELVAAYKAVTYALMLLEEPAGSLKARLVSYMVLAQVYAALGEQNWAGLILRHLLKMAEEAPAEELPERLLFVRQTTAVEACWSCHAGKIAEAEQWAQEAGLTAQDTLNADNEEIYLIYGRVLIGQGEPFVALRLFKRLYDQAYAAGRTRAQICALTGQALALAEQGHTVQAVTKLNVALTLGQKEGFQRSFLDDGERLAMLLQEWLASEEEFSAPELVAYVRSLAEGIAVLPTAVIPLTVGLPPQEAQILAYLTTPTASPDPAQRARELQIAPATLLWHEHRLCHRLGVPTADLVVQRAQQLGVMPQPTSQ
jgi:LuxR family transcriptional regulator, maltose regulon positive regulatory protein